MKELTLKQLYGYSIMNWEQYLVKINKASDDKCCSFCRDVGRRDDENGLDIGCDGCKINPDICNYRLSGKFSGIYGEFGRLDIKTYEQINLLINALKTEYNKL